MRNATTDGGVGVRRGEQIDYMLERGYAAGVLAEFIDGSDSGIALAVVDGRRVGFAAWYATDTPGEVKLDKLYVLQSHQRHRVGGRLSHAPNRRRSSPVRRRSC